MHSAQIAYSVLMYFHSVPILRAYVSNMQREEICTAFGNGVRVSNLRMQILLQINRSLAR